MQTFELKFEIVTTITELKHTGLTVIFKSNEIEKRKFLT